MTSKGNKYNNGKGKSKGNGFKNNKKKKQLQFATHGQSGRQTNSFTVVFDQLVEHVQRSFKGGIDVAQSMRDMQKSLKTTSKGTNF